MMAQVNAGRVRFVGRGEYNNSTQYYVFDLVSYNGNSYYAKADTIGNLPTNTTYWQLVAEKGNVGPTGLTGNGISSIEKTSTSGLVDTYTITYTNGNTTTFDVSNGNGIDRIEKTATVGNKDTYTIYFTNGSTTTYEVANGEVTREELEEEVERLSMIYNAFPSTTGEVEEASINGTAEVPFKEIGLKGNTSQESTTGKNLISTNINDLEQGTISGSNGENTTANNRVRNNRFFNFDYDEIQPNHVWLVPTGYKIAIRVYDQNKNFVGTPANSGFLGDLPSAYVGLGIKYIKIVYAKNDDSDITPNDIANLEFMISKGNDTSYEPYTGGNPAPNPDYPYPVNVVTGDNEVKVEGKNLAYTGWAEDFVSRINNSSYAKIENYENRNCLFFDRRAGYNEYDTKYLFKRNWKENTQYTFSFDFKNTGTSTYANMDIYYTDGTTTEILGTTSSVWNSVKATSSTGKTIKYLAPRWRSNETYIDLNTFMVYEGTDNADYVPYQSQTYPINLGSMELCKIGDYQDYLYKENGIWYKYGAIGKVVLDGTQSVDSWSNAKNVTDTNIHISSNIIDGLNISGNGLSNKLKYNGSLWGEDVVGFCILTNAYNLRLRIPATYLSDISTVQNAKASFITWLSSNPITVYFPLATPTITEITDTTLIEQLDNLEKAYSYDTQTNISQTNQDKPFIISYEAILSLKNVLNS